MPRAITSYCGPLTWQKQELVRSVFKIPAWPIWSCIFLSRETKLQFLEVTNQPLVNSKNWGKVYQSTLDILTQDPMFYQLNHFQYQNILHKTTLLVKIRLVCCISLHGKSDFCGIQLGEWKRKGKQEHGESSVNAHSFPIHSSEVNRHPLLTHS